jgi:nitrogen fixation/metabolism regulation signal transduction histidine kinase
MKKPKFYQRQTVTNPRLQIAVLLYSVLIAALVGVANQFLTLALEHKINGFWGLSPILIVIAINFLIFAGAVFFGFFFTNRFAGSIFRLRRHMKEVASGGEIKDFTLRKNDFFVELVEPYNEILAELRRLKADKK